MAGNMNQGCTTANAKPQNSIITSIPAPSHIDEKSGDTGGIGS